MDGKGEMSQVFENHKPRLIIGVTAIAVLIFVFLVILGAESRKDGEKTLTEHGEVATGITADGYPYKGSPEAPVKIIEYSDYLCGQCKNFAFDTEPLIVDEYVASGKVQYIFHYYALGEAQVLLGEASHCAADQGHFWEYHKLMFENQGRFGSISSLEDLQNLLIQFAQQVGADVSAFETCWSSHQHQESIVESVLSARESGVGGTPAFLIQGDLLVGNQPYDAFREAIEASLAEVEQ